MLYLLNKDVRTVRWNGEPLHEATSAIVKETMNGDFTLTVKYPISDSGIYQLIQEDMLIKAPTPVLGAQLFRIKKPIEHNDHLEITAYHISDDVMQRSITPVSVTSQSCGMALFRMVQNTKTAFGAFSFNSDIQDRRSFNTTETETLYSVLLDGKHSIVGTWEGELVRDNFAMTVKKSRGENRGVVITTHKNLKDYQRTKNSQNVVTRIHAKSTFKTEGAEKETTIRVTVDSPLINSYPYINEKEYENNNAKTVEELQKWAQSKFSNEGIDKVSDAIKIEAYELDGQVVHMGDTVNLKSRKHNVDSFKKAIAYEFDALKEEYISLTFDDKAGTGGSRASGGLSSAADAILGVTESAQEIALEKALQNADLDFDHKASKLRQEISDGIELAKARAEEVKRQLSDTIDQRFNSFDVSGIAEANRKAEEALSKAGANTSLVEESLKIGRMASRRLDALKRDFASTREITFNTLGEIDREVKKEVKTNSEYRRTTDEMLSRMTGQMNGFATKSEVRQDVAGLTETFAKVKTDTDNLISGAKSEITAVKTEFKKTAEGLSTKMLAVERYVSQDGQRQEALQRYARDESAKQVTAVRELVTRDYVGKTTYQEDVRGINQRIEEAKRNASNELTTRLANYRQTVDGKFTDISSQVTTYKQVADGQISNLSNRLTTEKQGTDSKIANLTNQVTTNKASSDNQIANLSNQLAKKVEITDFQRVRETSQLYERILGTTEQGLPDKVSRLVMSSSIFQTEVGNFFASDNNLIVNSETLDKYTLVGQRSGVSLGPQNGMFTINAVGLTSFNWSGFTLPIYIPKILKGEVYTISFKYKIKRKLDHEFRVAIKNHVKNKAVLQKVVANPSAPISSDWIEFQATSTMSEDFEFGTSKDYPLYFYLVQNGYVEIKEPMLVRGARTSSYKPSQFDDAYKATENAKQLAENAQAKAVQVAEQVNQAQQTAEATRTRVNQLAGSWAVQNLTSAGSIVSQINATNNQILIEAEKIRLKGKTLLDELTAIQGYFKRLFVGEGTFATLNADVIRANSITADKLIFDQAMANKFTANNLLADSLFAKQAFINRVQSVAIDASQVRSGILSGDRIYGGTIRGASIYGGTLTGHTKIQLGSYGSFDTVNGGLQINVPRTVDSKDGLGVQFIGSYGRGEDVPYGLFIYKDSDFTTGNTASDSDDFLLTVEGYIKAKGIGWFKTSKGNVGGKDTAKIGYWNSNISLDFGGSGNDIYYTYNGSAYSLWEVINKHFSDRRLKENIVICEHKALDYIQQFQFKEYDWKKQEDRPQQAHTKIGLIAQEVQEVDPTLVYKNGDTLNLDNLRLTNIALKAIQELALENKKLKHRLEKLENE